MPLVKSSYITAISFFQYFLCAPNLFRYYMIIHTQCAFDKNLKLQTNSVMQNDKRHLPLAHCRRDFSFVVTFYFM